MIPLIYLSLIKKIIKNFFIYLIFHLPVFATFIFWGNDFGQKAVLGACTVAMGAISLYIHTMEKGSVEECPPMKLCVILIICNAISIYGQHPVAAQYNCFEISVYILVRFIYDILSNTSDFIRMNQDKEDFPVVQMVVVNRTMMLLFLVFVAGGMFLFSRLNLDRLAVPIVETIEKFVFWILSFIHLQNSEVSENAAVQKTDIDSLVKALRKESAYENTWTVIEYFLQIFVILFLIMVIGGGIAYLFYRMYIGYYADRECNKDEKEFLIEELKWSRIRKVLSTEDVISESDNWNAKIRKEFKKYIKKYMKKNEIPVTLTPKELLRLLKKRGKGMRLDDEVLDRVLEIYEKARYGQIEIGADELEELKDLIRKGK